MSFGAEQMQLVRLVRIRQRRIDRALMKVHELQSALEIKQAERNGCEALMEKLGSERLQLRHAKTFCMSAKAADWMQQEHYGIGLQHRITEQQNRLLLLDQEVKRAEDAVDQARQQLRVMRQKLEALSTQARQYGEQVRREKNQKEQRKLDEQALGMRVNDRME